ncbi:MAG: transposase [Okeania sp. SIO3H1]|nr:transposase [Okeania sp. SIO3H1]NET27383.1 transposase [Okeania sp. SIO1I7]
MADRFYPSSQICSNCGHQQKMPLHLRTYKCSECGFEADRDLFAEHSVGNAAINLKNYVYQ